MSQYAMGRVFEVASETGEKTIRCRNFRCRTKLTQNEIQENDGLCNVCKIMGGQERVITQEVRDDHVEGDIY